MNFGVFSLKGKPYAATIREWREWKIKAKKEQPTAYWIHEVAGTWISRTWTRYVIDPPNNLRQAIRWRFFDRYNMINTGLFPGYYDCDTRLLYGMFNLLVDFIEIEKAWMHVVFDDTAKKQRKHPWWSLGWTRFKSFRDPEAGLAHLAWEMSLDDPTLDAYSRSDRQAADAREQLALYNWWIHDRPNRPDPYDASGWSAYCDRKRSESSDDDDLSFLDHEDDTDADRAESEAALAAVRKIETAYDDEDTAMLIRLISIRKGMWT